MYYFILYCLNIQPENEMVNKTWKVGLYAYEGYDSIRDDSTECYEYPDRIDPDSSWKVFHYIVTV